MQAASTDAAASNNGRTVFVEEKEREIQSTKEHAERKHVEILEREVAKVKKEMDEKMRRLESALAEANTNATKSE